MHSSAISVSGVSGTPFAPLDKFSSAPIGASLGKTRVSFNLNLFDPAFPSRSSDRTRGKFGCAFDDDDDEGVDI